MRTSYVCVYILNICIYIHYMVEEMLKQNTALGITLFLGDPLPPTIPVITSNHKEGICINLHVLLAS